MKMEWFISKKFLSHRKKTSMICVLSLCIGVLALIVVRSVFTGFHNKLKQTVVSVYPHIKIEKWGGLENPDAEIQKILSLNTSGLQFVSSFVTGESVLKSDSAATGVIVRGVDQARESTDIYKKNIVGGQFDLDDRVVIENKRRLFFFKTQREEHIGSILLGDVLAQILHVTIGDTVTLIAPSFEEGVDPMSLKQAVTQNFVVKGIFHLGMNDFDANYVLTDLPQAQRLFRLGDRVNGISLRFHDVDLALKYKWLLRKQFGPEYVIRSWQDVNANYFQAVRVEKSVQTIFLGFIVLVAAFNIFSTLIMIVMDKTKDIGILRAIGATSGSIQRLFLLQGFHIGVLGVASGVISGLLILHYRNPILDFIKETTGFELFPSDVYMFDGLPAEVNVNEIVMIGVFCFIAALLASFYPAFRASRMHPVEALRYE